MTTIDRPYPHSPEAEEALLGSLLIDPDAIFDVSTFLKPVAFYNEANRWIYEAILNLYNARQPLDLITLHNELRRRDRLDKIGGEQYLINLLNTVPTAINAESYGRIIEGAAVRRQMLSAASSIATLAYDEAEDISVVIDRAEQALFSISEDRTTRDLKPIKEIALDYWHRIEELHTRGDDMIGVPTGFTDLDRLLSGLNKSDLIIIAARPGMGKCVAADTQLVNPATGALTTIAEMVRAEQGALLTLGADFKLRPSQASHFVDDGIKPVYRVRTALGREIKVTLSHPFLTVTGWRRLAELAVGDHVAVPRRIPVFGQDNPPEHEVKTLAYLLADGCLTGVSPQFTNSNPLLREDFASAALQFPGNKIRWEDSNGRRTPTLHVTGDLTAVAAERLDFGQRLSALLAQKSLSTTDLAAAVGVDTTVAAHWLTGHHVPTPANFARVTAVLDVAPETLATQGIAAISRRANSLTVWLQEQQVWGKSAAQKEIPTAVFRYNRPSLALFLNRLFACDGSVYVHKSGQPAVAYSTVSLKLAEAVQHLLLRFGIIAKLRRRQVKYRETHHPSYELRITAAASLQRFISDIGALGKEEAIAQVQDLLDNKNSNSNLDIIPGAIWPEITAAKNGRSWRSIYREMGLPEGANVHAGTRAPSRSRLLALGQALQAERLIQLAESDVYWDKIEAIEYLGEQQVYDLTVPETHNFVANDVIVHNTAFQNCIALHAAVRHKKRVAMFNLEMSGEQLVQRMIALETRIDSQRLRRGKLEDHEWMIFQEALGRLSETRIFIDDTPSITPLQLRTKCRRLYAEHGIDLIMVDYLQLMQAEHTTNNRVQEISEISRSLKGLARELNVPVLAAAQLSRAVEQRQDKHPQLSDLRDSGSIEQDADIVLFIYRDEYYTGEATERPNIAEIAVAKHRNGPTGSIDLYWQGELASFRNLQRQEVRL
jgi:replicative DNA helicase